jgi:hypothetical protein
MSILQEHKMHIITRCDQTDCVYNTGTFEFEGTYKCSHESPKIKEYHWGDLVTWTTQFCTSKKVKRPTPRSPR